MLSANVDTLGIARQMRALAKDFGESNESAICRWGVATCRDLTKRTQAWGDDTKAKEKQITAIKKDANKAVFVVDRKTYVNGVASGKLSGLVINGELVTFTPDRILKTPQEVADFIDLNRTNRQGRVPTMKRNMKQKAAGSAQVKPSAQSSAKAHASPSARTWLATRTSSRWAAPRPSNATYGTRLERSSTTWRMSRRITFSRNPTHPTPSTLAGE
jgi:hypothetical protein